MEQEQNAPQWLKRGHLDEVEFCLHYLYQHNTVCVDGTFFTVEGRVTDESMMRKEIYDMLKPYVRSGLPRKVEAIMSNLRMLCRQEELPLSCRKLHVANGTYEMPDVLYPGREICRHRLPVAYNPDAPEPKRWLQFLSELLEEEDILTLQEYMGYCLIPTTISQKMLIITGKGGEGKSRIGLVLKALLGDNMGVGSVAKLEMSPFARADLENLLVFLDDDLKMEALTSTNHIKTIITSEMKMDLERKGVQSYQGRVYARIIAFGNSSLKALYDRSNGFFRRQIILTAKPRPAERMDDPFLADALKKEIEGIFLWCLEGLMRLIGNSMHFTVSKRAQQNLADAVTDSNNILAFMRSEGYFRYTPDFNATSKAFYDCYLEWCGDNNLIPLSAKTFSSFLIEEGSTFHISYTCNIPIGNGKHARGFMGVRICRF